MESGYLLLFGAVSYVAYLILKLTLLQAANTVVAGILHDVIDDTCESLHNIEEEFGEDVAKLVRGVSRISGINQV